MLPGTFNVYVRQFHDEPKCLIYNTLSKGVAVIPLKEGRVDFESLGDKEVATLEEMMIVVPSRQQEQKVLQCWLNRIKYGQSSLAIIVLTTRRCNLECSYCYQRFEDVDTPRMDMARDTADGVVAWIKQYVTSRGMRKIHLTFYGGEPLCNVDCITTIGDALAEFGRDAGVRLRTYLTTNGTLATPEVIRSLARYNLTQAQITLDGPPSIHDHRRKKHDGSGSFQETIEGLKRVGEVCSAIIRCNVDQYTIDSVPDLLAILAKEGLATKRNLFEVGNTYDCESGCSMIDRQPWVEKSSQVLRAAKSLGFGLRNPCKVAPCFGVREGSFAFDVDGSVYTCSQMAGYARAQIGNVRTQRLSENYYDLLLADALEPECYTCPYLPICLGGCRAYVVQRGEPVDSRFCAKDYFEESLPPVLSAVYE